MFLGIREQFTYLECPVCGSLRIAEIPSDLERFYPREYYAFQPCPADGAPSGTAGGAEQELSPPEVDLLRERQTGHRHPLFATVAQIAQAGGTRDSRILDVGCGRGHLLVALAGLHFKHLTGIDPFIERSMAIGPVDLIKTDLTGISSPFDLVMLHHSFEHLPNPRAALDQVCRLLAPEGSILLRCPVAQTFAWRTYGIYWYGLDPPRHLFIPSVQGMHLLAQQVGLTVEKVVFDSLGAQFWASEQYKCDVSLTDRRSALLSPDGHLFSAQDLEDWAVRAQALNAQHDGDQACFILRRAHCQGGESSGLPPAQAGLLH